MILLIDTITRIIEQLKRSLNLVFVLNTALILMLIFVFKNDNFKIGDRVTISKYNNIFTKTYALNWSEEDFVMGKVKNTVQWRYVFSDFNGKEIDGTFYEKELQNTNQEEFRADQAITRNRDKLDTKWKGYDNSFNI